MEITATSNIKNQSWSGVEKHMEHDPEINHSNQDIDPQRLELNQHYELANEADVLEQHYGDYVRTHDAKQKAKTRQYGSVQKYVSGNKVQFDSTLVTTFGNRDNFEELLNSTGDDTSRKALITGIQNGFRDYANSFNDRNSALKMTEGWLHMDEGGAPHLHAQVIPVGHTKSGKASRSFNAALKEQFGTGTNADNRELMKQWRTQEDTQLVQTISANVERSFKQAGIEVTDDNGNDLNGSLFTLARTGKAQHLSMDIFKLEKRKRETIKATQQAQLKQTIKLQEVRKQEQELKRQTDDLKHGLVDEIRELEPDHQVDQDKDILAKNKEPLPSDADQPVSEEAGFLSHLQVGFKSLATMFKRVAKRHQERVESRARFEVASIYFKHNMHATMPLYENEAQKTDDKAIWKSLNVDYQTGSNMQTMMSNGLSSRIIYANDPNKTELLQSFVEQKTMLEAERAGQLTKAVQKQIKEQSANRNTIINSYQESKAERRYEMPKPAAPKPKPRRSQEWEM